MKRLVLLVPLLALPLSAQETRMASDFEIAQMKQQIAKSRDFISQLSGHLNLGDLYATRNERSTAAAEYAKALDIASVERESARRGSDLTRYSTATSYAALASAKLGRDQQAFELLEEAMRYSSDSAKSWNLYSSAMSLLGKSRKAAAAARNAVTIATHDVATSPTISNRLDLAVYQYALATAEPTEAERLLLSVIESLRSPGFDSLKREIARSESFEIYSSARGDAAAYLSLLNRAHLRLAALLENRGDVAGAKTEYQRVLEMRTDDPTALAALARLSRTAEERERYFAAAFNANPFSMPLIREYQRYVAPAIDVDDSTTGGKVRAALVQMKRGDSRAASATLDALLERFPTNETLRLLRREAAAALECGGVPPLLLESGAKTSQALLQLLTALEGDCLTPQQRAALDKAMFTSVVILDATGQANVFESGTIDDVPFRFSEPMAFAGSFAAGVPLRLTYRILGATDNGLLLEPLRLEMAR